MNGCYDQMLYPCRLLTPFFHSFSYDFSSFIFTKKDDNNVIGSIPTEIGIILQIAELRLRKSMLILMVATIKCSTLADCLLHFSTPFHMASLNLFYCQKVRIGWLV